MYDGCSREASPQASVTSLPYHGGGQVALAHDGTLVMYDQNGLMFDFDEREGQALSAIVNLLQRQATQQHCTTAQLEAECTQWVTAQIGGTQAAVERFVSAAMTSFLWHQQQQMAHLEQQVGGAVHSMQQQQLQQAEATGQNSTNIELLRADVLYPLDYCLRRDCVSLIVCLSSPPYSSPQLYSRRKEYHVCSVNFLFYNGTKETATETTTAEAASPEGPRHQRPALAQHRIRGRHRSILHGTTSTVGPRHPNGTSPIDGCVLGTGVADLRGIGPGSHRGIEGMLLLGGGPLARPIPNMDRHISLRPRQCTCSRTGATTPHHPRVPQRRTPTRQCPRIRILWFRPATTITISSTSTAPTTPRTPRDSHRFIFRQLRSKHTTSKTTEEHIQDCTISIIQPEELRSSARCPILCPSNLQLAR